MSGTAKQEVVVAASSWRLFAPIIAGCVLFHRRYFSSRCAAGMASSQEPLALPWTTLCGCGFLPRI